MYALFELNDQRRCDVICTWQITARLRYHILCEYENLFLFCTRKKLIIIITYFTFLNHFQCVKSLSLFQCVDPIVKKEKDDWNKLSSSFLTLWVWSYILLPIYKITSYVSEFHVFLSKPYSRKMTDNYL